MVAQQSEITTVSSHKSQQLSNSLAVSEEAGYAGPDLNVTTTGLQPSTEAPLYCLETLDTGNSEVMLSSRKILNTLDSSDV